MLMRILTWCCIIISCGCLKPPLFQQCLMGYMTELQSWVDGKGVLTVPDEFYSAIDLSANLNPIIELNQRLNGRRSGDAHIKYLSMARCRLTLVPMVFLARDVTDLRLSETLEYITFYGNDFSDYSSAGVMYDVILNATNSRERPMRAISKQRASVTWSQGFTEIYFPHLKELDLRACSIQILSDNIFMGMPNLESLYIGENEVFLIDSNAFAGLTSLRHLDFSKNLALDEKGNTKDLITQSFYVFEALKNLTSLDLSFTKLSQRHISMLRSIGPKLKRLSLCMTGIVNLGDGIFNRTSIEILDLSGNSGIFGAQNILSGLENSLKVFYARDTGLRTIEVLKDFKALEILDLATNEIANISPNTTKTLESLRIVNLDMNRLTSWFAPTFSCIPNLELLSVKDNNINIISEEMMTDIANIRYLGMSGNFIVCNCHCRDFFNLAFRNELKKGTEKTYDVTTYGLKFESYHRAFYDFNLMIAHRNEVSFDCGDDCDFNEEAEGNFLLMDYHAGAYMCLLAIESVPKEFSEMASCSKSNRMDYEKVIESNHKKLYILFSVPGIMLILVTVFIFRRNCRYFLITVKNSAMLSLIHKHEVIDDESIFHYDVFVSYCNEDRSWVLDSLLPHLEQDCSVSACLHERDFQVGHSILENIASCMDRSRSIMLIISQRFLLSQWCQFEMHLAQHRLLETRREDLTLVLLEDIPRRLRPNTLHYLMLTKTYIVWPKDPTEQSLFWRRLKRGLVTMKQRQCALEQDSLA